MVGSKEGVSMIDKLQQLQEEHDKLEQEVGDIQYVLKYLSKCEDIRKECFAHTNRMDSQQEFMFTGMVDGKTINVMLSESVLERALSKNSKIDGLNKIKVKIGKIKLLLEEE